ncbi:PAS domain S-box protein, partial [bacterium]
MHVDDRESRIAAEFILVPFVTWSCERGPMGDYGRALEGIPELGLGAFRHLNALHGVLLIEHEAIVYCNEAAGTALGASPESLVGLTLVAFEKQLADPRFAALLRGALESTRTTGESRSMPMAVAIPTGGERLMSVTLTNLRPDGLPLYLISADAGAPLVGLGADLETQAAFIDLVPVALALRDTEGRYLRVNPAHTALYSQPRAFYEGKRAEEIEFHPNDGRRTDKIALDAAESELAMRELTTYAGDGTPRRVVSGARVGFGAGGASYALWSYVDVTERRQLEAAESSTRESLRTLAQALPIALFRCTPTGEFVYLSENFGEVWGTSREQALQLPGLVFGRVHPDERAELRRRADVATLELTPFEYDLRVEAQDGAWRWVHASAVPQRQDDGTVLFSGYVR